MIERAERAARERGATLPPAEQARLHYQLGVIAEAYWDDRAHLLAAVPIGPFGCALGAGQTTGDSLEVFSILAAACPEDVEEALRQTTFIADERSDEYQQMLDHFHAALRADSGHGDAGLRLLGYFAEDGEWEDYDRLVGRLILARPADPRLQLFAGLGAHERGLVSRADTAFRRGFALLPPEVSGNWRNISWKGIVNERHSLTD